LEGGEVVKEMEGGEEGRRIRRWRTLPAGWGSPTPV
jgi:hypothetical protein